MHWLIVLSRFVDNEFQKKPVKDSCLLTLIQGQLQPLSVRQHLIMHTLEKAFNDRPIQAMPLACRRNKSPDNTNYVEWTCPATILDSGVRGHREKLSDPKYSKVPPTWASESHPITLNDKFEVWPNTQCVKLNLAEDKNFKVDSASLKHLLTNAVYNVTAEKFVICAGAVLTPGILWNSGFRTTQGNKNLAYYVKELVCTLLQTDRLLGDLYSAPDTDC